jgi:hypothetical protein
VISHRFKRRAFLGALSGGVGLKIMLRNLESSAQTAASPPRVLVSYWPVGIIQGASDALWKPSSGAAGGYALQTFADNGLAQDMITIRGVSTTDLPLNGGGGSEGGTVVIVTGAACGGTRANRGEPDDAFASGPSFEQLLLANVPALKSSVAGPGYANAICDSRTDLGEISTKCLSYSNDKQPVTLYNNAGTGMENVPLMAELSPLMQYTKLFSSFVPTAPSDGSGFAAGAPAADPMLKKLVGRRSVLDVALAEIRQLRDLAPGDARSKLQNHYDAVLGMEKNLTDAINARYPTVTGTGGAGGAGGMGGGDACKVKPSAPPDLQGTADPVGGFGGHYGSPTLDSTDDGPTHRTVGSLHMDVLRAAFQCDIIRCGTFQWSPATNHVGFKGMYPGDDVGIYQHHPTSHAVGNGTPTSGTTPDNIPVPQIRFLFNVETWYFARHAENLRRWKEAFDGFGNPLLDTTIIPFVTENADYQNRRSNIPAMIFGGTKLGLLGGQYKTGNFSINQLWGTIASAMGHASTTAPFAAPIPGLLQPP